MSTNARPVLDGVMPRDLTNESRDREWIVRVREGDESALEAMFREYGNALCGFAHSYVRSSEEAQEIVQDLLLWIWQHRHEWDVTTSSLRTYLFQSTRNRAINRLRRRHVEQRFLERVTGQFSRESSAPASVAADQQVYTQELIQALDHAVAKLPERCREVFLLNRRQQMSYADIAKTLGVSVKTVEVHMGRALAMLRKSLADWLR